MVPVCSLSMGFLVIPVGWGGLNVDETNNKPALKAAALWRNFKPRSKAEGTVLTTMCSLIETWAGADLPALWYCVGWVGMQSVLLTYCYNIYTDNFSLWHWENDFLYNLVAWATYVLWERGDCMGAGMGPFASFPCSWQVNSHWLGDSSTSGGGALQITCLLLIP